MGNNASNSDHLTTKDRIAKFTSFSDFSARAGGIKPEHLHFFTLFITESETLTKENYQQLIAVLEQCKNLLHLDIIVGRVVLKQMELPGNGFDDSIAIKLAQIINQNEFLESLALVVGNNNHLSSLGLKEIIKVLATKTKICDVTFHLGKGNKVGNESFINLLQTLAKNGADKMTSLNLKIANETDITLTCNDLFIQTMKQFRCLQQLGLEFNVEFFQEDLMLNLIKSQTNLEKLTYFRFHPNKFLNRDSLTQLVQNFSGLNKLVKISFQAAVDQLDSSQMKAIIKQVLPKVQDLEVENKMIVPQQNS